MCRRNFFDPPCGCLLASSLTESLFLLVYKQNHRPPPLSLSNLFCLYLFSVICCDFELCVLALFLLCRHWVYRVVVCWVLCWVVSESPSRVWISLVVILMYSMADFRVFFLFCFWVCLVSISFCQVYCPALSWVLCCS